MCSLLTGVRNGVDGAERADGTPVAAVADTVARPTNDVDGAVALNCDGMTRTVVREVLVLLLPPKDRRPGSADSERLPCAASAVVAPLLLSSSFSVCCFSRTSRRMSAARARHTRSR